MSTQREFDHPPTAGGADAPQLARRQFLRRAGLGAGALAALGASAPHGGAQSTVAMQLLTTTLREISTHYFSGAPDDIVEGQRYLSHLLGAACEFYLEGDALRPYFVRMVSPVRKFLGDNPDAIYHFSLIDGQRDYRIRGQRTGQEYIAYTVHGSDAEDGDWNIPGIAHINHRKLRPSNRYGEYELFLGPTPRPGHNWLRTEPQARYIVCRHYYENRISAAADPAVQPILSIEPLPAPAAQDDPLPDAEIARRLYAVIKFLRASTIDMQRSTPDWWSNIPNTLGKIAHFGANQDDIGLGALDNSYTAGSYVLAPDQVLLMTGHMPPCYFANVVLWNRFLQTDDYRHQQISLNRTQMRLGKDSSYRIAIGSHNPRPTHWDWLDTGNRPFGIIQWRFLLAVGAIETPQLQLATVAEVAGGMIPTARTRPAEAPVQAPVQETDPTETTPTNSVNLSTQEPTVRP